MITFGTSGWRAIIAEEFTFANVRLVTQAIADVLAQEFSGTPVIVSYDPRFMAEKFAAISSAILAERGFPVILTTRDTPTPTIAYTIRTRQMAGAINFTASHNPPEYCGMKFSTANGAPALPEVTKQVEERIRIRQSALATPDDGVSVSPAQVTEEDIKEAYLSDLASKVDLEVIRQSNMRFAYDALWGTGRDYLDTVLRQCGCEVRTLHNWRDPYFGGRSPEPSQENLGSLRQVVIEEHFDLGLSTDGDADRFGVLDQNGDFITANQILALLLDYLYQSRGWKAGVGRSVATSHLLDRVAAKHNLPVYETPVGFKYIGELILSGQIILGGEESAGLSIHGHIPEKDGILACLLVAEMVANRKKTLTSMLEELYAEVGTVYNRRIGLRLTPQIQANIRSRLAADPPEQLGGLRVLNVDRTDGVKYLLENQAWLLIRLSGTEPVARCYAEANSQAELEVLLESGRSFILG